MQSNAERGVASSVSFIRAARIAVSAESTKWTKECSHELRTKSGNRSIRENNQVSNESWWLSADCPSSTSRSSGPRPKQVHRMLAVFFWFSAVVLCFHHVLWPDKRAWCPKPGRLSDMSVSRVISYQRSRSGPPRRKLQATGSGSPRYARSGHFPARNQHKMCPL